MFVLCFHTFFVRVNLMCMDLVEKVNGWSEALPCCVVLMDCGG